MTWKWQWTEINPCISQKFTRVETKIGTDRISILEIDPLVEDEVRMTIGEITVAEIITGQIIEIGWETDGTIIGQVIGVTIIGLTIDEVMIDQITDRIIKEQLGIGVKVEIELEIIIMTTWEVEVEIDIMIGQYSQDKGEMNLDPDPTLG